MQAQVRKTDPIKKTEEDEDFSDQYEICLGRFCFAQPYRLYVPPPFYQRIPQRFYRWKMEAKVFTSCGFEFKIERALALPNCLGLAENARWKWQMIPVCLLMGVQLSSCYVQKAEDIQNMEMSGFQRTRLCGYAKLKSLTPLFRKLALQPALDLFPVPAVIIKRVFPLGEGKVNVQAHLGVDVSARVNFWMLQLKWKLPNAVKVLMQPVRKLLALRYSRKLQLTEDCEAVITVLTESPSSVPHTLSGFCGNSLNHIWLESFKVSHIFGVTPKRDIPATASAYLKASRGIGSSDAITVVPGHWIDPGSEAGAPGEREFNLEVVNALERQLRANGWDVLRPDRDAPHLSWEEYLNWVSKQTLRGTPVLEIHGQGSNADHRRLVVGVIGDTSAPLNKELASNFGVFEMDWRDLGVPRRGGVIVESFNADEVMQMAPWHRIWAVRRLSNRFIACIERAGFVNRSSRGLFVDIESDDTMS